jgi:hypothetical protein
MHVLRPIAAVIDLKSLEICDYSTHAVAIVENYEV